MKNTSNYSERAGLLSADVAMIFRLRLPTYLAKHSCLIVTAAKYFYFCYIFAFIFYLKVQLYTHSKGNYYTVFSLLLIFAFQNYFVTFVQNVINRIII